MVNVKMKDIEGMNVILGRFIGKAVLDMIVIEKL